MSDKMEHAPERPDDAAMAVNAPRQAAAPTYSSFLRRFRRSKVGLAALVFLAVIVVLALAAPWISPYDPHAGQLSRALEVPSSEHWLGTDDLGRDIFSRLLFSSRVSLLAATQAISVTLIIGLPLGLVSGYMGGWVDNVIMRFNDALMSFPALILAVVIVGILGPGLTNAMIAIGLVYAPRIMRVVRGSALSVREEVYVTSARAVGCSGPRIVFHHVLPNILSPLVVQTTIMFGLAILAEAGLSFLGLGVQAPESSWGSMLGRAFPYMGRAPLTVIVVGSVISATVLAFNLLGDSFRDSLGRERRGAS